MGKCKECQSRTYSMNKNWGWSGIQICPKCGLMSRAQGVQQLRQVKI